MKTVTKKKLAMFGIFFGMVFVMISILITTVFFARKSWEKGLAVDIQNVLNEKYPDTFIVDHFVDIKSMTSTSSAVYSLLKVCDSNKKQKYFGVIIRLPSILGPLPAVFICKSDDSDSDVEFVGYASDLGNLNDTVSPKVTAGIMNYWSGIIPQIMKKAKLSDSQS